MTDLEALWKAGFGSATKKPAVGRNIILKDE